MTRITFALDPARGPLVIPGGYVVSTSDGQGKFATNENTTAPYDSGHAGAQLVNTVTIDCTCTDDGAFSNGYAINTVTNILSPQSYVLSATNIDPTSGGAETETDEAVYARWLPTLKTLSKGGPADGYEGLAYAADPTIVSVRAIGPHDVISPVVVPGSIEMRVLTDTGAPTQAVLDVVAAACSAYSDRPMTDTVRVYAANEQTYSLNIGLELTDRSAAATDINGTIAAAAAALQSYATKQSMSIGADVVLDKIIALCMDAKDGVKSVDAHGFTTLVVDGRSYARCTGITVSVTAINPA